MIRWLTGFWLLLALSAAAATSPTPPLVLVAVDDPPPTALTPADVRRLFLGIPQARDGRRLVPLHNTSDPLLYEVFLQKVVHMSARNYERGVLEQVFRAGGQRPVRYDNEAALVAALRHQPGAITYMWADDARRLPGIRVVQELWPGAGG